MATHRAETTARHRNHLKCPAPSPKPDGAYGLGHDNFQLFSGRGMIVLDVVHGRIMFVEVLFHPPLREQASPDADR